MSQKQWIGLVILLLTVVAVELCIYFTDRRSKQQESLYLLEFQPGREEAFLLYLDSLDQAERDARRAQYANKYRRPEVQPQPFDPNKADSSLLVAVGLKPWMASNLIRYRQAGKVFRQPDELRKLYGMNDSLYSTIRPYINIDTSGIESLSGHSPAKNESFTGQDAFFAPERHLKRDTVLDLNTADTASLQLLRGVGLYTAVRIIRYREALGGYHSTAQLYEIAELPAERIDSILPHLFTDTTLIRPLDANSATVRRLSRHPYITYRQAEQLYDLRRTKLRIHSLDELDGIFTPDERLRLAPYLTFSR